MKFMLFFSRGVLNRAVVAAYLALSAQSLQKGSATTGASTNKAAWRLPFENQQICSEGALRGAAGTAWKARPRLLGAPTEEQLKRNGSWASFGAPGIHIATYLGAACL